MGLTRSNVVLCDTKGVIYRGRTEGMNQWKAAYASDTRARSLAEALEGADVFIGLSVKGAVTQDMVKRMAKKPIIFAMANPDPEITPEEARAVRPDAIIATGRSDYPNQINNVLGFPYIFRGALDVAARTINEEMKIAAANALAELAREDVPDEVAAAYRGARPSYGPNYIIPVPFDPRLISRVSSAVAEAAMKSGVARRPIKDMEAYGFQLSARLDPSAGLFQSITASVRANPKRIVFAEGEEEAGDPRRGFVPELGARARDPGRPRRDRARAHRASSASRAICPNSGAAFGRRSRALYRGALQADAAARCAASRLRAHGDERPQCVRRLDGRGRRRRRHGHGRHAQLCGRAQRCAPGARSEPPANCRSA